MDSPSNGRRSRSRVVFMGTPDFAVPSLERLLSDVDVIAVYTQPDRPAGRGRELRASPVAHVAAARGVPVRQPASLRKDPSAVADLAALGADLLVVAAYGLILPPAALTAARHGALNVHASILPRWRGAAPIQHAILAGDERTGVTIMQIDEGLDTGPTLAAREVAIGAGETAGELAARLATLGADLLAETLPRYLSGDLLPRPQDPAHATAAPRLTAEDGRLDWQRPASELARRVRATNPWPGAFAELPDGQRLKVHAAHPEGEAHPEMEAHPERATRPEMDARSEPEARSELAARQGRAATSDGGPAPGAIVVVDGRPAVATVDGVLVLDVVHPAGRRPMPGADFLRGRPELLGARLAGAAAGR